MALKADFQKRTVNRNLTEHAAGTKRLSKVQTPGAASVVEDASEPLPADCGSGGFTAEVTS